VVAVAVASSQHRSITDTLARVACVVYVYITLVGEEVKPNRGSYGGNIDDDNARDQE
jgi:hypothetical protein